MWWLAVVPAAVAAYFITKPKREDVFGEPQIAPQAPEETAVAKEAAQAVVDVVEKKTVEYSDQISNIIQGNACVAMSGLPDSIVSELKSKGWVEKIAATVNVMPISNQAPASWKEIAAAFYQNQAGITDPRQSLLGAYYDKPVFLCPPKVEPPEVRVY
jgi:hypothetical protein